MSAVKEKPEVEGESQGSFLTELFRADLYKRNQGRITRQATGFGIAIAVGVGVYQLWQKLPYALSTTPYGQQWSIGICVALLLLGCWIAYRVVNMPDFADFLIAVEAEMNKVTWPSEAEVYRATGVVIFVMFALAGMLYAFDWIWMFLFWLLGVTPVRPF